MNTTSRTGDCFLSGRAQSAGGAGAEQQPTAGGGVFPFLPSWPALTEDEIRAGLKRMAEALDPELNARKIMADFRASHTRIDRNG